MVSGPYCGKLLADMGADVIKVEPPAGDPARAEGPFPAEGPHPEQSALFLYVNTSKRGMVLDVDRSDGLDIFKKLLAWADVLIDNHPPGRLEALGLDWETLQEINPGLIYLSITPYGRFGPRKDVPAGELTLFHGGGIGSQMPARAVTIDRAPVLMGGYPAGYHGGISASVAVMAAVIGRMKTGRGQLIDVSLEEVIMNMVCPLAAGQRYDLTTWCRVPDRPPAMGRMETSDGYVVFAAADDHHFRTFRELMGKPEWASGDEWDDQHYRIHHLMDIAPQMEDWMRQQKKEEIHQRVAKAGIPIGPINSVEDVLDNRQYQTREYFQKIDHPETGPRRYPGWPYKLTATPPAVSRPAPLLGQHSREICTTVLGYTGEEVGRFLEQGVIQSKGETS